MNSAVRPRIVAVVGTRPEAVKTFPIVQRLRAASSLERSVLGWRSHSAASQKSA
jgi:UDP-N-acetylglucosamine 2-epimerase